MSALTELADALDATDPLRLSDRELTAITVLLDALVALRGAREPEQRRRPSLRLVQSTECLVQSTESAR